MYALICLAIVLTVASVMDIRDRRVPNWITFPAMVTGLLYHFQASGPEGLLFSLEGLLLGFCLFLPFYLAGGMGAGDVKLLAAVGALLGPAGVFWACVCTAVVGGMYATLLLVSTWYRSTPCLQYKERVRTFIWTRNIADLKLDRTKKMPVLCYGVAIAIGTFLSLLRGTYVSY